MVDMYARHTIDTRSDIWALGCVLYQLCFGAMPFQEGAKLQILNGKYNLPHESTPQPIVDDLSIFFPLIRTPESSFVWVCDVCVSDPSCH